MDRFSPNRRFGASLLTMALFSALAAAQPAFAAEAATSAAAEEAKADDGAIVVTARKRSEDILKVPVTVVALTGEILEQRGVVSVIDVAASTPGININNSSSGHADRAFQQIIMRGFTSSNVNVTTTSMFIDGVPVSSPSELTSINNPERIEILKGPQSAYFGRSTFAGAINIVNRAPSDKWGGTLSGSYGSYDSYRIQGSVEGPIFGDVLTFRVTGDKYKKGGTWTNAFNNEKLGTTSTKTGTFMLQFEPTSNFKMKLFGLLSEDNDGPPAQARVNAYYVTLQPTLANPANFVTSAAAPTSGIILQTGQSNCTLTGDTRGVLNPATGLSLGVPINNPFICGTIPTFADAPSFNTTTTDGIRAWLAGTTNRLASPNETVSGYGLRRKTQHFHSTIDYRITNEVSLAVLGGYNREIFTTLIDLDGYDTSRIPNAANPKGYSDFPFLVERENRDWSIEGRLNYDSGNFKGLVGVSYLRAQNITGGGGASGAYSSAVFSPGDRAINKTTGLFFGLTYNFTPEFSISAEGRYQIDALSLIARPAGRTAVASTFIPAGFYAGGSILAAQTYKNFAPRVIASYQATPDMLFYGSVSRGINPALNNVNILTQSALVQSAAGAAGGGLLINPEKVTNYEVGLKGKAMGGALRYSIAAY